MTTNKNENHFFLSNYSEVNKESAPCLFWGKLINPFEASRCLIALAKVVQSNFTPTRNLHLFTKDPVVTAGNGVIRFEGFSQCAGVYARVDIKKNGQDGEFLASGTTNVDFNRPLLNALAKIDRNDKVVLSIGEKEMGMHTKGESIIERKVPLPIKWIKGLASVQVYMSESKKMHSVKKNDAIKLLSQIPTSTKTDFYLIRRGPKVQFTSAKQKNEICIGGAHRLKLLAPILPYIEKMDIYASQCNQCTTFLLHLPTATFTLSLSRESNRGFSGEGAVLESLLESVPEETLSLYDKFCYANESFNEKDFGISPENFRNAGASLSAMGLLGYDIQDKEFFYRRLPFKTDRIITLNPRMKGADQLIETGKVSITSMNHNKIEAQVKGSGVSHYVTINGELTNCTCTWHAKHKNNRGACKHILAVKKP